MKIPLGRSAWTPFFPSTSWVIRKSTFFTMRRPTLRASRSLKVRNSEGKQVCHRPDFLLFTSINGQGSCSLVASRAMPSAL